MNVCVFGAASEEIDGRFKSDAYALGTLLGKHGDIMVFGGGKVGLMGASARGVIENGGKVIGIAPRFFEPNGVLMQGYGEFIITDTMSERKNIMRSRSDAFIVLPGGIGTYEEFFETLTLKKLGQLHKPIIILNTCGYYDKTVELLSYTVGSGFMDGDAMRLFDVASTPEEAVAFLG